MTTWVRSGRISDGTIISSLPSSSRPSILECESTLPHLDPLRPLSWHLRPIEKTLLTLPLVDSYDHLTHTPINTHAHLYTWPGTNETLQPIVLMAHEDVVPVNPGTLGQWTHPPFDGFVDDEWVWGRGAADCKNQVRVPSRATSAYVYNQRRVS